jgi:hypothetical protein
MAPAAEPVEMPFHPWRGELVRLLDPAGRHELVEAAPGAGGDRREPGVVSGVVTARVGQVVPEPSSELGQDPPRRAPVADRVDDGWRVLGRDARRHEVPEGHVGALELILGGQHMGGECRRVIADDLERGEHVE